MSKYSENPAYAAKIKANSKARYYRIREDPAFKERKLVIAREHRLKMVYGMTIADYDRLLEEQGGVCAICGQLDDSGRELAIDHCHKTNRIRGLLCGLCNRGLGFFKDSIENLTAATAYLATR